ncbi:hypothetical protein CR203_14300 [Salipaludibacillus neizhouensis]|uniref:Uncharacterized protein n=1 Tax=Salipaludibacillus neizhouensis TaxID=885475 RepID=A0A3A9K2A8_9BACI|nr:hypothetical protein [Salipaludibacillus neizhouensis]RKL66469.1 hypothetical protein CR203_14300 [Salipaludibacillus neizhouensis]
MKICSTRVGMTIKELYQEAVIEDFKSLIYLIEWLVYEKKAITMDRDARNIEHFTEKYRGRLNPELAAYKAKVEGGGEITRGHLDRIAF